MEVKNPRKNPDTGRNVVDLTNVDDIEVVFLKNVLRTCNFDRDSKPASNAHAKMTEALEQAFKLVR